MVSKRKVAEEFRLFRGGASRTSPPTINAPMASKKKAAMEFYHINSLFVCKNLPATFSFDEVGAKEKIFKKKSAEHGGAAPPPRKLLKKLDQNFPIILLHKQQKTRTRCAFLPYFHLILVVFNYTFCRAQNLLAQPIRLYNAEVCIH